MRVTVDRTLCESNGVCVEVAPDVFELNDDDELVILADELDPARLPVVESAVARCPRQALRLEP